MNAVMQHDVDASWQVKRLAVNDEGLWARWDAFIARHWGAHAMLDSRFLRTTVEYFGSQELRLCQSGPDGDERALLLVEPRRTGVFGSFSPGQSQIAPLLTVPGQPLDLQGLFAALSPLCIRLDLFNIDPLFAQHALVPAQKVDSNLYGITTSVDTTCDFETYWAGRNKKLRDNIGRYRRRFSEHEGGFEFRVHTVDSELQAALRRYGDVESRGWKGAAGTAIHTGNRQGEFYGAVLEKYSRSEQAFAFELIAGDQVVASRLAVGSGAMLVMLKTTFDESYERFAPGRILLYLALEHIFKLGRFRSVEFYTNAQKEQLPWADATREISNVSVYRYTPVRKLVHFAQNLNVRSAPLLNFSLQRFDALEAVSKPALKLWEERGQAELFSSPDWFRNLYTNVGRDLGALSILVLENRAEEPLCILPCVSRQDGDGEDLFALANYYTPGFELIVNEALISRSNAIARLMSALARQPDWNSLTLFPMRNSADIDDFRRQARANLLGAAAFFETANWSATIADLESYKEHRPSQLRATLTRKSARLARGVEHRFEILTAQRDVARGIADFNLIYQSSWKPQEPYPDFIEGLATLAAHNKWLRLGLLYIEGKPAASQIWLVNRGVASIYKLAYSDEFKNYSPGTLLTMHLIEHVLKEDGVTCIDYLTGDDAYKRDWMTSREEMLRLRITNWRRPRGLYLGGYDCLRQMKYAFVGD
jgi:CelD/BcsL family acetyltransferase involved in cellulose biosynthesis